MRARTGFTTLGVPLPPLQYCRANWWGRASKLLYAALSLNTAVDALKCDTDGRARVLSYWRIIVWQSRDATAAAAARWMELFQSRPIG